MPLSITVLQALAPGARADRILASLQGGQARARRQTFGADNAVRLQHHLLPDQARTETAARLDEIDADWRDHIALH